MYKVMCWDSVDGRLNVFGIKTYERAVEVMNELKSKYPSYTFQIFDD